MVKQPNLVVYIPPILYIMIYILYIIQMFHNQREWKITRYIGDHRMYHKKKRGCEPLCEYVKMYLLCYQQCA